MQKIIIDECILAKKKSTVTIVDIARAANVSPATVSNAFNRPARVNAQTRAHVLQIASQLNFVPNQFARGLRGKKTNTVAILVSDIRFNYFSAILRGVLDELKSRGFVGVIVNTDGESDFILEIMRDMADQQVTGFIITNLPGQVSPQVIAFAQELEDTQAVRTVFIGNQFTDMPEVRAVLTNARESGITIVSHLVSKGHKQIGYVNTDKVSGSALPRWYGYLEGMAQHNLEVNPIFVFEGDFQIQTGIRIIEAFVKLKQRPTALVVVAPNILGYMIQTCQRYDIDIPTELSLVGWHDEEICAQLTPPITTVHIPRYQMGTAAVQLLFSSDNTKQNTVECGFIERASVADLR